MGANTDRGERTSSSFAPPNPASKLAPSTVLLAFGMVRPNSIASLTALAVPWMAFVVDANPISVADASTDPIGSDPPPPLLQRLLRFLAVDARSGCGQWR